jgi:hypothetical protein
MNSSEQLVHSYVRLARSWVMLPILAYLIAIPFLGPGALFVPIVIGRAPLGVISYFDKVKLDDSGHGIEIAVIHLVFWSLLVIGLAGRRGLPLWLLRSIWISLVVVLYMSVSGCAHEFGSSLRNSGNWH